MLWNLECGVIVKCVKLSFPAQMTYIMFGQIFCKLLHHLQVYIIIDYVLSFLSNISIVH